MKKEFSEAADLLSSSIRNLLLPAVLRENNSSRNHEEKPNFLSLLLREFLMMHQSCFCFCPGSFGFFLPSLKWSCSRKTTKALPLLQKKTPNAPPVVWCRWWNNCTVQIIYWTENIIMGIDYCGELDFSLENQIEKKGQKFRVRFFLP